MKRTLSRNHAKLAAFVAFFALCASCVVGNVKADEGQKHPKTGTLKAIMNLEPDTEGRAEQAKTKVLNQLRLLGGTAAVRAQQWENLTPTQVFERLAISPPVGPSTIAAPKPGAHTPSPAVNWTNNAGGPSTGDPGVALLLTKDDGSDTYYAHCTGTLIRQNLVLTAAHCVCAYNGDTSTYPTGKLCKGGTGTLAPSPMLKESSWLIFFQHVGVRGVSHVEIDDQYQFTDSRVQDDLAILVLDHPVTEILPGSLPVGSVVAQNWSKGTVVGFGNSGNRNVPNASVQTDLIQPGLKSKGDLSLTSCATEGYLNPIASLCSKYGTGPGMSQATICSGDSGGPLWQAGGGSAVEIGLTSGRIDDCTKEQSIAFEMSLSFRNYSDWINEMISRYGSTANGGQWPVFGENLRSVVDRRSSQFFDASGNYVSDAWEKTTTTQLVLATINTTKEVDDFELQDRSGRTLCKGAAGAAHKVPNVDFCWATIQPGMQFRVVAKGAPNEALQFVLTSHAPGTSFGQIP
ncbi:trypsin-like serine protease [Paraburkholderia aspalathi]|uniref:S1 family peptidase n=1 Tax=Paraburkholderia nemoris TaxID=2793076 RepID=UPI0019097AC1|nr:trypsin-like serine protease [Paraburkholderia nemoris]MBK3737672.1 trypsin-like serine protease [Paraburkholderia aspalathi]